MSKLMNKSEHTPLPLPLPCPPDLIPTHTLTSGSRTRTPSPGPGPLHLTLQATINHIAGDDQEPQRTVCVDEYMYMTNAIERNALYKANCAAKQALKPEVPGPTRSFCHPPCRLHPTSRRNNYDVRKST